MGIGIDRICNVELAFTLPGCCFKNLLREKTRIEEIKWGKDENIVLTRVYRQ